MSHTEPAAVVSDTPCPRCRCHLVGHFECGCGAVHDDYCTNCGRFRSLPPTSYIELSDIDAPCTAGPVAHEHPVEQKAVRFQQHIEKLVRERDRGKPVA